MKEAKRTFEFLKSLVEPDTTHENVVKFCSDLIKNEKKNQDQKLDCRHECFFFGSLEKRKHPGIRKSTLRSNACLPKKSSDRTTKIRCYHIAFFSKFRDDLPGLANALKLIDKGYVIRHRCGCRNCSEPGHLFLGTHAENMNDRGIHFLLDKVSKSNSKTDLDTLRALLLKYKLDQF